MSEWPVIRLGECLRAPPDYGANAAAVPFENGLPRYVRITDVANDGTLLPGDAVSVPREFADGALLEEGDIVFARSGATVGKTLLYTPADGECAFAGYLIRFRTDSGKLLPEFLSLYTRTGAYWRWVARTAHAGAQPNISAQEYLDLPVPGPAIREQEAIVRTVSVWERAQRKLAALLDAKRRFKHGLAEQLLTGKRRFKEFEAIAWAERRLGDVTHEATTRNAEGLPLARVMAVRKHVGIVPMKEGVASADLERYKLVEPRWFAYNPMRLNIGSIAMWAGKGKVLVSPDYVVFRTLEDQLKSEYLKHVIYTSTWTNHLVRVGSGGVRVRIWYDDLAGMRLRLPPPEEQTAIATLLTGLDEEVTLLGLLRDALDRQRRGIAELLLTGKIRVPA